MKIEDKRTNKGVTIVALSIGDCFIYNDELYIKLDELCASPNTFNLTRNEMCSFHSNMLYVTKVNAKVVIE